MRRIGRKKLCPCGSGKKYINCCYKKDKTGNKILLSKGFSQNLPEDMVVTTLPGEKKMSEVLLEFATPLTDELEDDDVFYRALNLAAIAWNASFFPIEEREKIISENINEVITNEHDREMTKAVLFKMILRKDEHFPNIKRMIVDLEISYIDGNLHLDVISSL